MTHSRLHSQFSSTRTSSKIHWPPSLSHIHSSILSPSGWCKCLLSVRSALCSLQAPTQLTFHGPCGKDHPSEILCPRPCTRSQGSNFQTQVFLLCCCITRGKHAMFYCPWYHFSYVLKANDLWLALSAVAWRVSQYLAHLILRRTVVLFTSGKAEPIF